MTNIHSIHCAGYRGVGKPWDEDKCDCHISAEQKARNMLEQMSSAVQWNDPQRLTAGDVVELANLIADNTRLRGLLRDVAKCGQSYFAQEFLDKIEAAKGGRDE